MTLKKRDDERRGESESEKVTSARTRKKNSTAVLQLVIQFKLNEARLALRDLKLLHN